jgi:transcriptional regulator with XRE-family HTH domain
LPVSWRFLGVWVLFPLENLRYDLLMAGRPAKNGRPSFGERLALARQQAGLTQQQLAERLDVTQRVITYWEREPVALRAEQLAALADALGVTTERNDPWIRNGKPDAISRCHEAGKDGKFFKELGARLVELRRAQGLTQAQMAELLGISQQQVACCEKGQRRVSVDLLPQWARLLGVTMEELLGLEPQSARRGPTPKLQQQLERISRLPRAKQRIVMEMLDGVLSQAGQ